MEQNLQRVVHTNYPDNSNRVYCRRLNKVVTIDSNGEFWDTCLKCPMYDGNYQGQGVECAWNDVDNAPTYCDNPTKEQLRVSQLIGKDVMIDLTKSMDKNGLVQVQRTVNGKHGTYQRMQWVKASDVQSTDKVVGQPTQKDEKVIINSSSKKWVEFDPNNKEHSSSKDAYCIVSTVDKRTRKVNHKKVEGSVSKIHSYISQKRRDRTLYDSGNIYVSEVDEPDNASDASKPAEKSSDTESRKQTIQVKLLKKTSKSGFSADEFSKLKSDRPKAIQYLKDQGVTWKENPHDGINWMRACMAAGKTQSTPLKKSYFSTGAQDFMKSMYAQCGNNKDKTMCLAKSQGITWEDTDNKNINWMRATLAIQKYYKSKQEG